jgi:hypothetical protein
MCLIDVQNPGMPTVQDFCVAGCSLVVLILDGIAVHGK